MNNNSTIENFAYTGKNVPVNANEMFAVVEEELTNFDNQGTQVNSPYQNPIIVKTEDEKTIQIPMEIHKKAIIMHLERIEHAKNNAKNNTMPDATDTDKIRGVYTKLKDFHAIIFSICMIIVIVGMSLRKNKDAIKLKLI